jgi:hypothetical protein
MNNYNPQRDYYNRMNKTQRRNNSDRQRHQSSNGIGGCSCNYTINTDFENKSTRPKEKR